MVINVMYVDIGRKHKNPWICDRWIQGCKGQIMGPMFGLFPGVAARSASSKTLDIEK